MIYHRIESPTQTMADAENQVKTTEIWGGPSRYSYHPRVRAYVGPLPPGRRGVEFRTEVPPDEGSPPGQAAWSPGRPGVRLENGMAKLTVHSVTNMQEDDSP